MDQVIECMQPRITEEQNSGLSKEVTETEVKAALCYMYPDKSPGTDGMSPGFYQKHWQTVGEDIVKIVKQFFRIGDIDQELQSTNIVLIPKKKNPLLMTIETHIIVQCSV